MDEGAAQAELLLHAARELAGGTVEKREESRGAGELLDAPFALGRVVAEEAAEEVDVLRHGERRIEVLAQALGHVGDVGTDPQSVARVGHVSAQHPHLALLDGARSGDERQQAGFSHPVGADEPYAAAGGDIEIDPVECARLAIGERDSLQPRNRLSHHGTFT